MNFRNTVTVEKYQSVLRMNYPQLVLSLRRLDKGKMNLMNGRAEIAGVSVIRLAGFKTAGNLIKIYIDSSVRLLNICLETLRRDTSLIKLITKVNYAVRCAKYNSVSSTLGSWVCESPRGSLGYTM